MNASPKLHFTRRRFIKTVAIGTSSVALGATLSSCSSDPSIRTSFDHGVASGDPLQDRAVIWTRVTPEQDMDVVPVSWAVATDPGMRNVVGSGTERTNADQDYTLKLDVTGLEAGRTYYFQFSSIASESPVGRLQTLPTGDVGAFSVAVVSCSNYPAGFFHAYGEIAARDDINAVLHLGDYIYEYGIGEFATEDAEALGRVPVPSTEILVLADYRQRYAQYRSDENLQEVHRRHSFICVWDDHEVTNDTWREGAENHNEGEGDFSERKAQAIQAYYEWMPIREPEDGFRERLYRRFQVGNLLDLYMLDTRIIGRDEQLAYSNYIDPTTGAFNTTQFQADLTDTNRTLLGFEQRAWLLEQMAASTATWQVMGQQVLSGRMTLPAPLVTFQVTLQEYLQLTTLAQTNPGALTPQQLAIVQAPSIPYNLDAWDGYFSEREVIFQTAEALNKNTVWLAGDTHNGWANNLSTLGGTPIGVEFATPGVTSPGFETFFADEDPNLLAGAFVQFIEGLQYANLQHRGYMVVNFTPDQCQADWAYLSSVKTQDYSILNDFNQSLRSLPGVGNRQLVNS